MATKRSGIELTARVPEEGLRFARTAEGGYELLVAGAASVNGGSGEETVEVRRTFPNIRAARRYARQMVQLVDELAPRRSKRDDDAEEATT